MKTPIQYVSLYVALAIHELSIRRYGGIEGVRDQGLLESALAQPQQTFDGIELYPSLPEKAARYAFGIINNHPFADGNKRTGAAVLGVFLRSNDVRFKPRTDEFYDVIIAVADGTMDYDALVAWIERQL